jgi:hypothetical protein
MYHIRTTRNRVSTRRRHRCDRLSERRGCQRQFDKTRLSRGLRWVASCEYLDRGTIIVTLRGLVGFHLRCQLGWSSG